MPDRPCRKRPRASARAIGSRDHGDVKFTNSRYSEHPARKFTGPLKYGATVQLKCVLESEPVSKNQLLLKFRQAVSVIAIVLAPTALAAETLVLGSVNDDIRRHMERFAPLAEYLQEALADDGITAVEIAVLPDSEMMAEAMRAGEVDLYFDSPLVAARVARLAGGEPFLRRWKNGVSEYHSIFVVPTDSPFQTIEDLGGAMVGFQEPDSTSGFMLPAAQLRSEGLALRNFSNLDGTPNDTEVGYVFTGDDRNTVAWLVRGRIDAGATDPRGLEWLQEARPGEYRVLARSISVPRHVVIRRGGLDPVLANRISAVLEDMVNSPDGIETMDAFNDTTRFDRFPLGVEATFGPIYDQLDLLAELGLI